MTALLAALSLAVGGTPVLVYTVHPQAPVSKTVRGSCFAGSLADGRADAWRCSVGNQIMDPCFQGKGYLLCPPSPRAKPVKLILTKPLPRSQANKSKGLTPGHPWLI